MREREREIAPRVFLCAHVYTNEESALLDLPTLRHPFKSLFKTRPKRVSLFTQKEEKKEEKFGLFRRFPISLHFLKKTHLVSLFFFFFFFREREKER